MNEVGSDRLGTPNKNAMQKSIQPRLRPFGEELEILRLERKLGLCRNLLLQASQPPGWPGDNWEAAEQKITAGCDSPTGLLITVVLPQNSPPSNRLLAG
jgi:hypothetical protein